MGREIIVIGGGIVGLATAFKLLRRSPDLAVTVLEKECDVAAHQTGHNSGVVHAGLYYRPGSDKARLCVRGRAELVAFCAEHDVPHEVCGKVVVACDEREAAQLDGLQRRGEANGLRGLRLLTPGELREREPHVHVGRALLVPETGIVDFRAVAHALVAEIQHAGGRVITRAQVLGMQRRGTWTIDTTSGHYSADFLVACAGLQADRIARLAGVRTTARIIPFRGDYFNVVPVRASLVRHLVYPVPDPIFPFLGVHATRAIDGHRHVGPSASIALARETYRRFAFTPRDAVDAVSFTGLWRFLLRHRRAVLDGLELAVSRRSFLAAVQRLIPELSEADLEPATSGIRAQALLPDGTLVGDFLFAEDERAIHVLNAPSPAATACLAIGDVIAERALVRMNEAR